MVRENMRSPRAELSIQFSLVRKLQGFLFWVRLPACDSANRPWCIGGISSNGRAVASHATGKGIDAPILHSVRVAHELEPPFPGLVSSVGRAHDSYDLRRSHERRRLLRSCGRGFNPRIGCKGFRSWFWAPLFMSRVFEEECPADPGSSPGEGDNKYTATTVVLLSLVV